MPRAVLGIDAAWTQTEPSGVALVVEETAGWRLIAAVSSYRDFLGLPPSASRDHRVPSAQDLLARARGLVGDAIDLVAIDMPLSRSPIVGRRPSDDAVSRLYGARKAGTHTPSAVRPGPVSDALSAGFTAAGYPLHTMTIDGPGLIEVYPHPALIELARAPLRLQYKASKVVRYWPAADRATRRANLVAVWRDIVALLDRRIGGVVEALPLPDAVVVGRAMKAFEDRLDAVVCAWIGMCALEGRATPHGDDHAATWIPNPLADAE